MYKAIIKEAENKKAFSNILRSYREQRNLTLNEVAKKLRVSQSTYRAYEDNHSPASVEMFVNIIKAFNFSVRDAVKLLNMNEQGIREAFDADSSLKKISILYTNNSSVSQLEKQLGYYYSDIKNKATDFEKIAEVHTIEFVGRKAKYKVDLTSDKLSIDGDIKASIRFSDLSYLIEELRKVMENAA